MEVVCVEIFFIAPDSSSHSQRHVLQPDFWVAAHFHGCIQSLILAGGSGRNDLQRDVINASTVAGSMVRSHPDDMAS